MSNAIVACQSEYEVRGDEVVSSVNELTANGRFVRTTLSSKAGRERRHGAIHDDIGEAQLGADSSPVAQALLCLGPFRHQTFEVR